MILQKQTNKANLSEVIHAFLNRPLEDSLVVKGLSDARLDAVLSAAKVRMTTTPMRHQKVSTWLGIKYPNYLFLLEQGLGKSKVYLDVINYRLDQGQARAVILLPRPINVYDFVKNQQQHSIRPLVGTLGTPGVRAKQLLQNRSPIVVSDYYTLQQAFSVLENHKSGRRWVGNKQALMSWAKTVDIICYDEVHLVKNNKTLRYKLCALLSKSISYRYGGTGTPINRDIVTLWHMIYLIDHGAALGDALSLFLKAFCVERFNPWTATKREWLFNEKRQNDLHRALRHSSISYGSRECLDLPDTQHQSVLLKPSQQQQKINQQLCARVRAVSGHIQEVKNTFLAMRALSSSLLAWYDEEGHHHMTRMGANPKIEWIKGFFEAIDLSKERIVIMHGFTLSGQWITQTLASLKIDFVWIYGGSKKHEAELARFYRGEVPVLVGNIQSVGTGLNLQQATCLLFYELPISSTTRLQALKRCQDRIGTATKTRIIDLMVDGMIDFRVMDLLMEGKKLHDAVVGVVKSI